METNGISPKVYVPMLVSAAGAGVLYLIGEVELAVGVILAVISQAGLGYAASPGAVDLDEDVVRELYAELLEPEDFDESGLAKGA